MKTIRTALVTGAASGIGRALVDRLASGGTIVYAADVRASDDPRPNVISRTLDVRDSEGWRALVDEIVREHEELSLLANVAGVLRPAWAWAQTDDDVDWQIDVNVKGVIHGCRAVVPSMKQRRAGTIVNVSSLAGITPTPGISLYSASKFAVRGYSLSIMHELAEHGVHVGVVCPDAVQTPMLDDEVAFEEAALTFSGARALTTGEVVDAIIDRVVVGGEVSVALPASRGVLAQISGLLPGVTQRLLPLMRRRGRAAQKKRSGE